MIQPTSGKARFHLVQGVTDEAAFEKLIGTVFFNQLDATMRFE